MSGTIESRQDAEAWQSAVNSQSRFPDVEDGYEVVLNPEQSLKRVLQDYRALAKSVNALIDSWAEDVDTRNRPNRQKLCSKLCDAMPKPLVIGKAIDDIAVELGVKL